MSWVQPKYKKGRIDWAGRMLVQQDLLDTEVTDEMTSIINNWRSSHNFPLNTFHVGLKQRAKKVDPEAITAQRIKRLASIKLKLERFPTMQLSQIQDIGGCRAIVGTLDYVDRLVAAYEDGNLKHELYDIDDYIDVPKETGYRGIHLKWKYYSDRSAVFKGLRIEMQIRSRIQHVWATAVETVDTLLGMALKSSMGDKDWARFFALMGCAFSYREGTPPVPDTPTSYALLIKEIRLYARKLDVMNKLKTYAGTIRGLEMVASPKDHFFLLQLDAPHMRATYKGFRSNQSKEANDSYIAIEQKLRSTPGAEAVLVSVDSISALRSAYPNYFLDTENFRGLLDETVRSLKPPEGGRRTMPRQLQLI